MLQAMATGQPAALSMEQIHAGNAEHARRFATCTKAEALAQHDQGAAYARAVVRGLTDDQLARDGEFLVGVPMTVEQAVHGVLINHPRQHAATIQAALNG
jgi:hypothetical protein